jgi:hypothetical protein
MTTIIEKDGSQTLSARELMSAGSESEPGKEID